MIITVSCAGEGGSNLPSVEPVPTNYTWETITDEIYKLHDIKAGVTCYVYGNSGTYGEAISCVPDLELHPQ